MQLGSRQMVTARMAWWYVTRSGNKQVSLMKEAILNKMRIGWTQHAIAVGMMVAGLGGNAIGQTATELNTRALAATCANCHGTDGRAVPGSGSARLAGQGKEFIVTQLQAFRDGTRQATVMHQLAKGYSNEQIDRLAAYFAAQK